MKQVDLDPKEFRHKTYERGQPGLVPGWPLRIVGIAAILSVLIFGRQWIASLPFWVVVAICVTGGVASLLIAALIDRRRAKRDDQEGPQ